MLGLVNSILGFALGPVNSILAFVRSNALLTAVIVIGCGHVIGNNRKYLLSLWAQMMQPRAQVLTYGEMPAEARASRPMTQKEEVQRVRELQQQRTEELAKVAAIERKKKEEAERKRKNEIAVKKKNDLDENGSTLSGGTTRTSSTASTSMRGGYNPMQPWTAGGHGRPRRVVRVSRGG